MQFLAHGPYHMNDFTDGPCTAARLLMALEDSRSLRAQLGTTRRATRSLVDTFNTELRTYISFGAVGSVPEITNARQFDPVARDD